MAKDKTLALTIKIAGKMDKSLVSALNSSQRQISGFSRTLSRIGTVGLAAMGTMTTATVAGLKSCANEAVKYQNELGDVIKYVDGLADASGKITNELAKNARGELVNGKTYAENYDLIYDSIQRISTQVPLTREYLAEMTAAIGQSGKSIEQMFTTNADGSIGGLVKDAAVMAAAWDIEAKEAAEYAAKWENSFNMSHSEVMELANQINYLGANSATTAAEIANAVNQSAALGQLAGIDPTTTVALADAMLATGVASDRVGTSIKRMALNLSKGADMTKKQKGVLDEMGLSAEWVSKSMTEDSVGTLQTLFEGISNLPKERQLNAVGQLFGVWAAEGGAKIVNNLDVYQKALEMVADQEAYMNSMQREFNVKSATPEAVRQMRNSAIDMFKVNIGKSFVPLQTQWDDSIRNLMLRMNDNMPQFEQLSGTLAELATKGIEKIGDVLEKALPYITKALDYVNNNGPQVAETVGKIAAAFVGMKFAPAIEGLLGGGANLLFGSPSAFGGRNGGLISSLMGVPGAMKTAIFGHALKSGGTKGGLINGAKGLFGGLLGSGKAYGGSILEGLKGVGGTKIGSGILGGLKATGGVTAEILKGIYGATFKDLVDGGMMLGGMGIDALKNSKAGQFVGGAAGKAMQFGGKALSLGKGVMGPIAELGGAIGGLGSAVWAPISSMFGGILTGAAPVVLAISGIVLAVDMIGKHALDIRRIITNVFGEKGGQVFDKFAGKIETAAGFIKGLFAEGGMTQALGGFKESITGMFGENAGAAFGGLITILESISGIVRRIADFARGTVKPIIAGIFNFITQTVVPKVLEIFTAAAPYIAALFDAMGNAVMTAFELIGNVLQTVGPIVGTIITALLNLGGAVLPAVLQAGTTLFEGITLIIQDIQTIFNGLIEFITGVFTGNWEQAWNGVKEIFGGIFSGLVDLVRTPVNAVIDLVNSLIDKVNGFSFKIPDNVPLIGGQGFDGMNIPHIPQLAKGGWTTGPSIAGEAGMEAVISFQRSARRENIALWQQAGKMLGVKEWELATIDGAGYGGGGDIIFSPQITIMGNADRNEVQEGLQMAMDEFEKMYDRMMQRKKRYGFATV